jgi:hypothetical protein
MRDRNVHQFADRDRAIPCRDVTYLESLDRTSRRTRDPSGRNVGGNQINARTVSRGEHGHQAAHQPAD